MARRSAPVEPEPVAQSDAILSVGFNQDFTCFACGTGSGFRVYNCDPFKEVIRREFDNNGGIGLVEMLFKSNISAIVGGGNIPCYPPTKVMIWDDHQSRCIEELSFRSEIRAVRLRNDRIVVVLEQKIFVYNFKDYKLRIQIETVANPKGLCAISSTSNPFVLACPALHQGQVRVEHYSSKMTKFIHAHDSNLACFSLTLDGRLLATSSNKGTLIRIFNTLDGTRLQELRRGTDRAEIYSLAFSQSANWLALSSDKGTVHVFSLRAGTGDSHKEEGQAEATAAIAGASTPKAASKGSTSSMIKGVLPKYFSSKWSFAQFRLPEETRSIVAFGPQNDTVFIVGNDGTFYKCAFDPVHGGKMEQKLCTKFIRPDDERSL